MQCNILKQKWKSWEKYQCLICAQIILLSCIFNAEPNRSFNQWIIWSVDINWSDFFMNQTDFFFFFFQNSWMSQIFKSCQMNGLIQATKLLWMIMNQTDSVFEINSLSQIFLNNLLIQVIKVLWMIHLRIRMIQCLNSTHWVRTV